MRSNVEEFDRHKPRDLLIGLAESWCTWARDRGRVAKPGQTVMGLSEERRELLRSLRSSDIADVRIPPWLP